MVILAIFEDKNRERVVGLCQFDINKDIHTAEVALVVKDGYQNMGVGHELLSYLSNLARKRGLLGFTAEVLTENKPMLDLFENMGFEIEKRSSEGAYEMRLMFREA